jgi:hypothetical protein
MPRGPTRPDRNAGFAGRRVWSSTATTSCWNSSRPPIRRLSIRRRERLLTEGLRHTHGMASQPSSSDRFSVAELTVRSAESDLLEVDALDFGPDAPATAALEVERGPEPRDMRQRGD